ncbi:MAG: rRNA pseudouridine synthase [Candidatus Omnitrophica bacterium]|nr:rRNA pseudouridine synthase [Candidatus Omnitrophota bacterium]
MRLNLFISRSGFASRRKADYLITSGKVKVNGLEVREPWYRVNKKDKVEVEGRLLEQEKFIYIAWYKPKGVVTTLKDRFAKNNVRNYFPYHKFGRVFPVGRLDKDSEGLLLLTNDGRFCFQLTHPKFKIEKEYMVTGKGRVSNLILEMVQKGIKDGKDLLHVDKVDILKINDTTTLRVLIHEGRKRHLRRLFSHLGFKVLSLKRIRIANICLSGLKPGEYRILSYEDIKGTLGIK